MLRPGMQRLPASPASFLGRQAELGRVTRLWDKSRLVLVLGAAGIGKSAFMRRLVEELAGDVDVWGWSAAAGSSLLHGLEGALRLPDVDTSDADRLLRLAEVVERARGVVCLDDAASLGEVDRRRLVELCALLRRGHLVVASRRRIELGEAGPSATVVELGPLSADEATQLVAELLDRVGRAGDPRELARRAAGSPLSCRLLAGGSERILDQAPELLAGLGADARALLPMLATFAEAVDPATIGASPEAVRDLEERFLVDRAADGFVSVPGFVREAVLVNLDSATRADLHRACARVYEGVPRRAVDRLRHLEAAGDAVELARALDEGAAAWLWTHRSLGDLMRLCEAIEARGVALPPRVALRRVQALAVQGRTADARCALDRVGDVRPDDAFLRDVVTLAVEEAEGLRGALRANRYRALLGMDEGGDDVAAVRRRAAAPPDLGQLANGFVRDCLVQGHLGSAFRVLDALGRHPGAVDEPSHLRIARRTGDFLSEQGDRDRALAALTSAESAATHLGSPQLAVAAHNCLVDHHVRFGDLVAAERHLALADALPVPTGHLDTLAIRELRRAELLSALGRLHDAQRTLAAALERYVPLADALSGTLTSQLAITAALRGDAASARRYRDVLLQPRSRRGATAQLIALEALGRSALAHGRPARAMRAARVGFERARRATLNARALAFLALQADAASLAGDHAAAELAADAAVLGALALAATPALARALATRGACMLRAAAASAAHRDEAVRVARQALEDAVRTANALGDVLTVAEAEITLAVLDLVVGLDDAAAARLGAARARLPSIGAPRLDGVVALLTDVLRARAGHRRALRELEIALATAGALPLSSTQLLELARRPPRLVITRAGRHPATAATERPEAYDLWMDAAAGVAIVGGVRVELAEHPVLRQLLEVLLADPSARFAKQRLFEQAWGLPYRATRDATLHKAVARLAALLGFEARGPRRFGQWTTEGAWELAPLRTCLLSRDEDASLNDRQRWILGQLDRQPDLSNRDVRAALGVPRATAQRDLEHLEELGLVQRLGKGRATRYRRAAR